VAGQADQGDRAAVPEGEVRGEVEVVDHGVHGPADELVALGVDGRLDCAAAVGLGERQGRQGVGGDEAVVVLGFAHGLAELVDREALGPFDQLRLHLDREVAPAHQDVGLGLGHGAGRQRLGHHGCGGDLLGQGHVAPDRAGAFPGEGGHPGGGVAEAVAPMGSAASGRVEEQQLGGGHRLLDLEAAMQSGLEVVVAHRVDRCRGDDVPASDPIEERHGPECSEH